MGTFRPFRFLHPARIVLLYLGATNAMQDAVVLSNCLYNISEYTPENITKAFEEYYKQRYHRAKEQVEISHAMTKILAGQVNKCTCNPCNLNKR